MIWDFPSDFRNQLGLFLDQLFENFSKIYIYLYIECYAIFWNYVHMHQLVML